MYEAFFGMEHTPFVRDVPPEKLYESNAFRETLGRLSYVADRQMFAVVTADPGCGKSTLIRRFYSELPKEDYIVLYLSDSKLTPRWFYKGLLDQLGLESRFYRGDSKRQLQQATEVIRGVQHKKVVCILWENKLKLQRYAAVRQRIDMYCTLPHLDRSETEQYIASHMDYSGCIQEVFTAKALDEIHKASAGIPRMVNRICEKALMYAFQNQKRLIDDYMIKFVIEHEMLGTITT